MSVMVSYNTLMNQLEKELSITVRVKEDATRFRRKLSQAKHRLAIDGKLIFSTPVALEDGVVEISIALEPKKNEVQVMALVKKGDL